MIQMNAPDTDNAQEIDLIELAKRLWSERKFLFKCCGIAVSRSCRSFQHTERI